MSALLRCFIAFWLIVCCAACTPAAYRKRLPIRPAHAENDAGAHDDALHEWWYWTGHLESGDREFGFELTFFRVKTPAGARALGFLPAWWLQDTILIGHFALTDVDGKRFHQVEASDAGSRSRAGLGRASSDLLDVRLKDWSARQAGTRSVHHLDASGPGFRASLIARATKPVVLHGDAGVQAAGDAGVSYYVSQTRMTVDGTITVDGQTLAVTGLAWHDHQWGDWRTDTANGWDWYSMQLDDETELMLYQVDPTGAAGLDDGGSFIDGAGRVATISKDGFSIAGTGMWTSPEFGRGYPMGWRIEVPEREISLVVTPLLENQEFDGRRSIGIVYWEGAVKVEGTRAGQPVKGKGYVELTNYSCAPTKIPPHKGPLPCPEPVRRVK